MRACWAVLIPFLLAPAAAAEELSVWTFQPNEEREFAIRPGVSLGDKIARAVPCCNGVYRTSFTVQVQDLQQLGRLGLYIPAAGGLRDVRVNGTSLSGSFDGSSSTGPLLPLAGHIIPGENRLELLIEARRTPFSGLWKSAPIVDELSTLEARRLRDVSEQTLKPLVYSILLITTAFVFLVIFVATRKLLAEYGIFAASLSSWALFYFFLSGVPRSLHFEIGSALHFPVRTLAGLGLLLQIAFHCHTSRPVLKRLHLVFMTSFLVQLLLGVLGEPTGQALLLIATGILIAVPLVTFSWHASTRLDRAVFVLAATAFLGQLSDSIKLLDGLGGYFHALPYLNRYTFPPLLFTSLAVYIRNFTLYYRDLHVHLSMIRRLVRSAITMGGDELKTEAFGQIARALRRIATARRVTIALRDSEGRYQIGAVSGVTQEAIGKFIDAELPGIAEAIRNGNVVLSEIEKIRHPRWRTRGFAVIPVPLAQKPEMMILVSDPVARERFEAGEVHYFAQFSAALWANLQRTRETEKRIQSEKRFQSLVAALDPNLYQFITRESSRQNSSPVSIAAERGIVYFDQKAFTSYLEALTEDETAAYAELVSRWVTQTTGRFGGRIRSFGGDAYLIEVINIAGEPIEEIALRTLRLVWELSETVADLNRELLKQGLNPVAFRFGAHIGRTADVNLDFIQRDLSSLVGDAVNVTARLQNLAPSGRIYVTEQLAILAGKEFQTSRVERNFLKGRTKAVEIREVIGRISPAKKREVA